MTTDYNFDHLRLKLAIRKTLLGLRDHEYYRTGLMVRYPWASKELFDRVVEECLREGTLTERQSDRGAAILTWHDAARQEKALTEILATAKEAKA